MPTDKKRVDLKTRRERPAKGPSPKKFEDKSVKRAKEQIKQKKDSATDSVSRKRRKRRSRVFERNEDCNAFCPKEKNNICGYSCYVRDSHDPKDCRCRKHFNVTKNFNEFSSQSSTWKESNFKVPVEPKIEEQEQQVEEQKTETKWTPEKEQDLKEAYDLVKAFEKENQEIKDTWEEYQV